MEPAVGAKQHMGFPGCRLHAVPGQIVVAVG
jgi:hypothetical protein